MQDGIACLDELITYSKISDGLSKTLLIGDKWMDPFEYETGQRDVDDAGLYVGLNADDAMFINSSRLPVQDIGNIAVYYLWGGAHPGVWNAAYCDGSVQSITYDAEEKVLRALATRAFGD